MVRRKMSSFINKLFKKGVEKTFFRLYVPRETKQQPDQECKLSNEKEKSPSLHIVCPDFKINEAIPMYIPLQQHSLEAFGKWTYKTAEVLLEDEEKLPTLIELFENRPIVLYIHGFVESSAHQSVRAVVDAYLQRGDHNVLVLDWSGVAQFGTYIVNMARIQEIGKLAAQAIDLLFTGQEVKDITLDRLHIVAHSMGSHLASFIARNITIGKLKRITALDPASPIYKWLKPTQRLSENDADFVDVLHTDGARTGLLKPCGHVDFYPNGGKRFQPGCPEYYSLQYINETALCSHWRSWKFYAESVISDPSAFMGCKASSWKEFRNGTTVSSDLVPMGFHTPSSACGEYYLQTNGIFPFSRGEDGLKYFE